MKEKLEKLKDIVNEIEEEFEANSSDSSVKLITPFEIPEIVSSIIDFLQPLIHPYQAAIYWYMFNNSILKNGTDKIRISTRGLGKPKTVVKSSSGQSEGLSYASVQEALKGLEEKEIIKQVGDTNREGTLYKINIPEEIEICRVFMNEKVEEEKPEIDEKKEVDFYNVKENRLKIFERDKYICHYCKKQLTRFSATLDHILPVSKGGDNSFDNLITACLQCNSQRTNNEVMDAIIRGKEKSET